METNLIQRKKTFALFLHFQDGSKPNSHLSCRDCLTATHFPLKCHVMTVLEYATSLRYFATKTDTIWASFLCIASGKF